MEKVERCQCEYRKGGCRWFVQLVWHDSDGVEHPLFESQCPHYRRKADALAEARRREREARELARIARQQQEAWRQYLAREREYLDRLREVEPK